MTNGYDTEWAYGLIDELWAAGSVEIDVPVEDCESALNAMLKVAFGLTKQIAAYEQRFGPLE